MSKISTYEVVPVPKLADKLIGTSVGGEIEDATYNFTLQELLDLFLPNIPANNLQGVLDYGNTATQDINLFGTITTTNLDVTDTANLFITYLNEETHIVGGVYDSEDSVGTSGQVLTSTGEGVAWVTLPPIFTPNLQQVLTEGNTSTIGIVLDATLEALNVDTDDAIINTNITIDGTITDGNAEVGAPGQVLSSTATGVEWVDLPAYSAVSPLLFNSVTGVFSIQQASNVQGGYLSASDWVTFDGKQNAGNYITALTGEASASGPGAASTILSNAAVISKVLTGFNPTAGTINASDSILTAFGKTQSQINALVGGVQYKGTWNASTNVPTLQSSVGVQGNYYIVSVAGNTNLNGITDWQVGDWAIFSETTWQKVDNTESVTSVNGFTGAVSLTTDNIPEGSTNLYYLDSRARGALSFAAGSGAYNNVSGVITIPTNNNQILNGAGYITLASLSASAPLSYNNLTGGFAIQKSDATHDGYLSSTDWSTFNNKQNYLGGTGLVKSTAGTISYITDNSGNWNTAYDRSIVSAAVTGTTTKTLTLNEQDGNTITASWTDLDTGLTSVGVSMPSAFSVANSPLTANGTIAVTGAGTTLQYIDGTGALQTFPGLTGFVPYTGATQNVNLGTYGLLADYLQLNTSPTSIPTTEGTMSWNSTDGTMDLKLKGGNVTLQVGEENVTRVVNKSGIDLLEENYQVVRARKVAEGGAQGQRIAVVLAQGNSENSSTEVLGLVTETINVNQEGFITCFGEVKEINTTGSLQGETWVDGDILYLSNTTAGALTNVRPVAPNHSVIVGYVTYAHAVHGKIYMAIDTGYELGELHNVYAPSPTANQSIYWNVANSRYQLNTIGGILGYTPANAATLISTTAPLSGGGDLSANRTLSISQAGTSTDGYLSSTDWNTFNNKQPAGSYVPTSRLLSINGTQYDLSADRSWSVGTVTSVAALTLGTSGTDLSSSVATGTTTPVITLNVPTASAANRGALSAADWSTFNTKVGSVTASSPLASSGGSTPNITIQQASGSQNGYLSSTDWTTFNNKQAAGNYITSLTGEATAAGPGAAAVTLNNASVTAKVLTGINITGGTVQATDTMLTAFGKLQNQINGLIGSTIYQGTWNASTNTPALASGVGTRGYYYIVSVAGNTNLDGITDWFVGDWAIFDGTAWQQVDNTDAVVSVNGQTGAVSLTTDNIPEGATNQYFLNSRARAALSFAAGSGAYNSTSGLITIPTNTNQLTNGASFITLASLSGTAPIVYSNTTGAISITQAGTASNGYLSSTDWNTFNNKASTADLANYLPLAGGIMTGQIVLKESSSSTDYTKGLRFPNDPFGGSGDISGLRLYATSGESMVLELYVGNDSGTDKINFATGASGGLSNNDVTINGNVIWNAGNITPAVGLANNLTTNAELNDFSRRNGMYRIDPGVTAAPYDSYWSMVMYGNSNNVVGQLASQFSNGETYVRAYNTSWSAWRKLWDNVNLPTPQTAITLTTTGTSGVSTFNGVTLNIPNYGSALSGYLPLSGGTMTGQIVLKEGTTSTDYTKGLRFPNDPYGGSGDTSGLRLYAETTTGAEAQVLELYVTNDVPGPSVDRINFAAPNNDLVTVNGYKIWNAGNLPSPQSAITLTTTGTSGAATLVGATLNIPQYQSVLTNPVTGVGSTNRIPKFTGASTIGDSVIFDNGTNMSVGSATSTRVEITDNAQVKSYYAAETLPRYIINRDLFGGGLSGIGFTDREATLDTWGVAVGLSAARELGFFVSNGTSLIKQAYITSTGAATFLNTISATKGYFTDYSGVGSVLSVFNYVATNATTAVIRQAGAGGNGNQDIGLIVDIQAAGDQDRIVNFRYYDGTNYNSRFVVQRGGNVGIGLINPSSLLHIYGAGTGAMLRIQNTSTVAANQGPLIQFQSANQVGGQNFESGYIQSIWQAEGNAFGMRFAVKNVDSSQAEVLRINYNGNVGINTAAPITKFEVVDSDGSGARTSPINIVTITAENPSNPYNGFGGGLLFRNRIYSGGPSPGGIRDGARIRASINTNSSVNDGTDLVFDTTVTGNGSLTETARFSYIYGNSFKSSFYNVAYFNSTYGQADIVIQNNGSSFAVFGSGVSVCSSTGISNADVGIGTAGGNTNIVFATGSGYIEKMRIANSGNVAIGNINPLTKLHVNDAVSGAILPYINATSLSYNSNGISVAGTNPDNSNVGNGVTFYNNVAAVGTYGPVVAWSSQTVGGAYNSTYAFITGVYNGAGGDSNWAAGSIIFGTANSYGAQERMRLNRVGFLGIGSDNPTATLHVVDGSYNRFTIRVQSAAANIANAYGGIGFSGEESNTKGAIFFQSIGQSYARGRMIFALNNVADQSNATPSNAVLTLSNDGTATFVSSVTATSFFESSDSRLKNLIKDKYKALGIESIKARLYIKDGKEEIGYFAQDFESILPSAVSKNDAGFLSLSYTQVHTAKIAFIEDEVDLLKKEVAELKVKLQKYEA